MCWISEGLLTQKSKRVRIDSSFKSSIAVIMISFRMIAFLLLSYCCFAGAVHNARQQLTTEQGAGAGALGVFDDVRKPKCSRSFHHSILL